METTAEREEFPAPVDPPTVDFSMASDETGAQVAAVTKSCRPKLPVIFYRLRPKARLKAVGQYIASFEYSLHPQTNFNSQKQRPLFLIMETAKTIINAPQPIKCVEAVFVALLLTAGLPDVERFPLSFQTVLDDQVAYRVLLNIKICMILLDHRMRGIHQAAQVFAKCLIEKYKIGRSFCH
ncbi:hypothetical protein M758_3G048900 [Ceratodon purpureus]|nr:hypothetical protein M758_3G048900 [Ceratodon purpureus]